MKYLIAFIVIACISCKDPVTFDRPQPDNTESLTGFPEKITGNYLSTDKASILSIDSNSIIRTYDFDEKELKDSLDTSLVLKGDTLFNRHSDEKVKVILKGDTLLHHVHMEDTMFVISDSNILKHFKGFYFLNCKKSNNSWFVQKLSLSNGILTLGEISDSSDLNRLKEITETQNDTVTTPFSLSRKQFRKFLRHDGFSKEQYFTRIKLIK